MRARRARNEAGPPARVSGLVARAGDVSHTPRPRRLPAVAGCSWSPARGWTADACQSTRVSSLRHRESRTCVARRAAPDAPSMSVRRAAAGTLHFRPPRPFARRDGATWASLAGGARWRSPAVLSARRADAAPQRATALAAPWSDAISARATLAAATSGVACDARCGRRTATSNILQAGCDRCAAGCTGAREPSSCALRSVPLHGSDPRPLAHVLLFCGRGALTLPLSPVRTCAQFVGAGVGANAAADRALCTCLGLGGALFHRQSHSDGAAVFTTRVLVRRAPRALRVSRACRRSGCARVCGLFLLRGPVAAVVAFRPSARRRFSHFRAGAPARAPDPSGAKTP
jgi:hypothetical protein